MKNIRLLLVLFLFFNQLAFAQTSCTVYWGDASCSIFSSISNTYVTYRKSVKESDATGAQTVTIHSTQEYKNCTAALPNSKVTTDVSKCGNGSGFSFTVNGLNIYEGNNEEIALNYTYPSVNIAATNMLQLFAHRTSSSTERVIDYKIISAPPGVGTEGKWIRLGKLPKDGYFYVNLASLLNSNITGPLPKNEMLSPDPMTKFSKIHFRWQFDRQIDWSYTGGTWIYNSQSTPVTGCQPLFQICN